MSYSPRTLKYNQRERAVQEEAIKNGWKVIYKGWPDFLFYKKTDKKIEAFFVEVKRKPYGTPGQKQGFDVILSPAQKEVHRILTALGFKVNVIYKD
jgi:hypothetical protein